MVRSLLSLGRRRLAFRRRQASRCGSASRAAADRPAARHPPLHPRLAGFGWLGCLRRPRGLCGGTLRRQPHPVGAVLATSPSAVAPPRGLSRQSRVRCRARLGDPALAAALRFGLSVAEPECSCGASVRSKAGQGCLCRSGWSRRWLQDPRSTSGSNASVLSRRFVPMTLLLRAGRKQAPTTV